MIPTPSTQNAIDALEFARDALLIDLNNIYWSMLGDALKGEFGKEMALATQKELILMREAKQKIDEAIATLQAINLDAQHHSHVNNEVNPYSLGSSKK